MRPEYNDKIIEANLMAPAAFLKGTYNPYFSSLAASYRMIKLASRFKHNLVFDNKIFLKIGQEFCKHVEHKTPPQCKLILNILNSNQVNCVSEFV